VVGIADDAGVRAAAERHEQGFWVLRDDATGRLMTRAFPPGAGAALDVPPTPHIAGQTVVAFGHTHPNPASEGYLTGASPADRGVAGVLGLPGIIRAHDGYHVFGPGVPGGDLRIPDPPAAAPATAPAPHP
jgi:hypothetical protein